MTTLSIDGIDPAFLTIDGQRVAPRPRDPAIRYIVAPPVVFDVTPGWHTLRYDLAGGAVAMQARDAEAIAREIMPPVEVRVNVPAEGLHLRRIDRFFVDPRGIATPTGYTGGVIVPADASGMVPDMPMSFAHKAFMVAGGLAIAVLAWQALTSGGDES